MTLPWSFYAHDNIIGCILIDREHELDWVASQFTRVTAIESIRLV